MPISKRHHFLPQFYLEGFCSNGSLCLYDRETRALRQQTPVNTAVQTHYYSFIDEKGERNTFIESDLSIIEGATKPIIANVDEEKLITSEEQRILSLFVALLRVRTPGFEKQASEINDKIFKEFNKIVFSREEWAQNVLDDIEAETGQKLELTPKELKKLAEEEKYELITHREETLSMMFPLAFELAGLFMQMDWVFAYCPSEASFITSDNPFTILPPHGYAPDGFRRKGILTPGAKKIIPLSQKTCLMIFDQGESRGHIVLPKKHVRGINTALAQNCNRFIIGRDEALIKRIVRIAQVGQA